MMTMGAGIGSKQMPVRRPGLGSVAEYLRNNHSSPQLIEQFLSAGSHPTMALP
jgi:hypothetical protein